MRHFRLFRSDRLPSPLTLRCKDIDWSKGEIKVIQKGGHNLVLVTGISPLVEAVLRRQVGHHATSVFTYVCERTRHERDERTGQPIPSNAEML